jgi:hypothetical protein
MVEHMLLLAYSTNLCHKLGDNLAARLNLCSDHEPPRLAPTTTANADLVASANLREKLGDKARPRSVASMYLSSE